jgi:biopolymer transport protein ExbB
MLELLRNGGPLLWVIVACAITALGIFVERVFHLHRAKIKTEDFLKGIINVLDRGNIEEALAICEETPGPVPYIVKTAIIRRHDNREAMRDAVDLAGRSEIARMERRLAVLSTVAQTAPLLGLLGTVIAMIEALLVMRQQAPLVQSANIVEWLLRALVTTAAGLTVAIPCYAGYSFLVTRIEKIVLDMERAASEILAHFAGRPGSTPNPMRDGKG